MLNALVARSHRERLTSIAKTRMPQQDQFVDETHGLGHAPLSVEETHKFLNCGCNDGGSHGFFMKHAQVKIMIALSLQLWRCAIGPNALSRLSVAC